MRHVLLVVVSLVVGALIGRWSASVPDPPPPPEPVPVVAAPAKASAPLPPTLPGCQQELALARAVLQAQELERTGTPVPFPADLPEAFRPDRFEAAMREVVAACPDAGVELARVDCSEYPCMAWFAQETGDYNHAVERLVSCEAFEARFGRKMSGQGNTNMMTDQGVREYSMVAPRASGTATDDNDGLRFQLRNEEGRDALMELWGGREFTDLEKLDQSIAFWREAGGAGSEDILRDLEAQRAKLEEAAGR